MKRSHACSRTGCVWALLAAAMVNIVSVIAQVCCDVTPHGEGEVSFCEDVSDSYSCCRGPEGCQDQFCKWVPSCDEGDTTTTTLVDSSTDDGSSSLGIIIGAVVGVLVLCGICAIFYLCYRRGSSSSSLHVGPPATTIGSVATVNVVCGSCRQMITIDAAAGIACRFKCTSCGAANQFSLGLPPPTSGWAAPIVYPSYWSIRSASKHEFLTETEEVKKAMQSLLDQTWKDQWTRDRGKSGKVQRFEVVHVQRNENPKIWEDYQRVRDNLREIAARSPFVLYDVKTGSANQTTREARNFIDRAQLCKDINEYYLFHGTKPSAAKAICDNDFLEMKAGSNAGTLYGPGLYFAESSSKSDEYAADDKDGIFSGLYGMLVCRVACGNMNYTDEVAPPVQSLVNSVLKSKTHHSILGDREKCRGTYREFIVFDSAQTYPEYVVIYKRVDK
eukprot:CAMPEP_0170205746 /NCGR_PEP_ID=MMETSP0116_2-20130129/2418_1 /TAXON_ID=400756 /ORGANISM="Durinskia baltica, Strain CSIRO CS-38" /LENGTH=444 /DNA_ID=CAMNT_0010456139 /DNA_START=64 /DNA_END=1398 /DNA_ORIENTATION=-